MAGPTTRQAVDQDAAGADPPRRWTRLVLAVGVLAGLTNGVLLALTSPEQVGIATDVYHHAATRVLAGEAFYGTSPPAHPGFEFVYPPVVVVAFLPYALVGSPAVAYGLATLLNLATAAALGVVLVRAVERAGVSLARLDRLLVVAAAATWAGAASTIVQGQINLQLALLIAGGVLLLEDGRESAGGLAVAVPAVVKLFPLAVWAWLVRRRAWRAVAAAVAVAVGLGLASLALFGPDVAATWAFETVASEASVGTFADGPDPDSTLLTVRRQLAWLAPWLPAGWLLPAAGLLLAPVVLAAYRTVETYRARLVALEATLLAMLIAVPLEPFYLALAVFPTVPLVYLTEPADRTIRRLFLAGTLVVSVPVVLPSVELVVEAVAFPPWLAAATVELARTVFAFALPQMVGIWLLLAACVLYQHRMVRAGTPVGG